MNTKLIEYTPEQIDQACETGGFSLITFYDEWCGVEDLIINKVTEKCIWPHNSHQARMEKMFIGSMHWSNVTVIKGDENQVIDTYYQRVIEEKEEEIAKAQDEIAKARTVMFNREILKRDPESKRWVRS